MAEVERALHSFGKRLPARNRRLVLPASRGLLLLFFLLFPGCGESPSRGTQFQVFETSIVQIQEAIFSGSTTCRSVVQSFLDRIEAYDQSSGLNSIAVINGSAVQRAEELDRALQAGKPPGSLFCAPIVVKDNFHTHDMPTSAGSIVLKESLPPEDAFMVRKIREADGIILAKTNMAEWAFSPRRTESSSYGITANAYALDRVPAGSSGGTASAVAASFGVAGLGTDTGNSIRGPSSHLALFGLRSTIGLTSRHGVVPLNSDWDIAGPMTRTVEDGARLFQVIAGHDPNDPITEPEKREEDYLEFLDPRGLEGARIGVLRVLVGTQNADPRIVSLFERALQDMESAGAVIVDPLSIPEFFRHVTANYYCPTFRYEMRRYLESLGKHAPFLDVREGYEQGLYSPYVLEFFSYYFDAPLDVPPEQWNPPCPSYRRHPGRMAYLSDTVSAMDEAGVDVLVYPTWTHVPAPLDRAKEEYRGDNSQLVAPATGMPAATVPMGFTAETLPAGLQILARPYQEGMLFKIAFAYEQHTRRRHPPGAFPPLESIPNP